MASPKQRAAAPEPTGTSEGPDALAAVAVARVVGIASSGLPLVEYAGSGSDESVEAETTVDISTDDVGRRATVAFLDGNRDAPVITGLLKKAAARGTGAPEPGEAKKPGGLATPVTVDGERVVVRGKQRIVLECGKASITLTADGKVIVRGTYVHSQSSGVARIQAGILRLN